MRYHYLRYDVWVCLALSVLIGLGAVKIAELFLPDAYESYTEEHTVAEGEIGGIADESFYRIQNVDDLLEHDTFTIESPGIEYCNRGAGYYGSWYMYAVTLPSGERVAAVINGDSVQRTGETIYDGVSILPVGRVVYEDLTENETFLNQIEYSEPLSRTDLYIDMLGTGGKVSEEDYTQLPTILIQLGCVVIFFPLFHALGAKLGIFPYFFAPKKKKTSEWE